MCQAAKEQWEQDRAASARRIADLEEEKAGSARRIADLEEAALIALADAMAERRVGHGYRAVSSCK